MAEESPASLAQRIDELEARAAVADVIHAYARHIRYDEPDQVPALFAPDAVFETRHGYPDKPDHKVLGRMEGRDAIAGFFLPMKGKLHPIPLIRNVMVTVDGDSATSTCVMDGQIYGGEHKVFGEYRDSFQRIDGRWYFSQRVFTMFVDPSAPDRP